MNVTIILVFWMVFRFPYIFKPTNKTDEKNHFQFRNRQFIQHLFMNTIFYDMKMSELLWESTM